MNEVEITRLMKDLMRLLQNRFESEEDEGEVEERLEEINDIQSIE